MECVPTTLHSTCLLLNDCAKVKVTGFFPCLRCENRLLLASSSMLPRYSPVMLFDITHVSLCRAVWSYCFPAFLSTHLFLPVCGNVYNVLFRLNFQATRICSAYACISFEKMGSCVCYLFDHFFRSWKENKQHIVEQTSMRILHTLR